MTLDPQLAALRRLGDLPGHRVEKAQRAVALTRGLNGACVSSRRPVVAQDVANDPRYLTTIGGTRGEMIQPVMSESGVVVGTIDVESELANAFSSRDEELLALCAQHIAWLWLASRNDSTTPAVAP